MALFSRANVNVKSFCQLVIALMLPVFCAGQTTPLTLPVGGLKAGTVIEFSGKRRCANQTARAANISTAFGY